MTIVRPGEFKDLLKLKKLATEMYERSVYADRCTVDLHEFRSICFHALSNHGRTTCLFVAEEKGEVVGFIVGTLDRVFHIAKEFLATDIFFFVGEEASARSASKLLDAFTKWGESSEGVIEVYVGVSGAIGNPERISKMYERKGYRRDGLMLVKEVGRE